MISFILIMNFWKIISEQTSNILQKNLAIYNSILVLSIQLVLKPYITVPDLLLLASVEIYLSSVIKVTLLLFLCHFISI